MFSGCTCTIIAGPGVYPVVPLPPPPELPRSSEEGFGSRPSTKAAATCERDPKQAEHAQEWRQKRDKDDAKRSENGPKGVRRIHERDTYHGDGGRSTLSTRRYSLKCVFLFKQQKAHQGEHAPFSSTLVN